MPMEHNWYLDTRPFNYTTSFVDPSQLIEMFGINETERKNNMDIRDKICDKCGKRYSIANMRIPYGGGYVDKTCYVDNKTPIENYPKLKHSVGEKYIGADMDLCSECAEELKKFAGEE